MRIGEGARSAKLVLGEDEGAHAALGRKRERRGRQALSVEANSPVTDGRDPPRPEWPGARARNHYGTATEEPRQAVTSARPCRPLRARPWRLKRGAHSAQLWTRLWALNGPVPYQVRMTLERPEHKARKTRPSKGVITDQWSRSPLSANGCHRCPQSTKTTDQRFEGQPSCEPSKPADAKVGGNRLPPRNSSTDQGFETCPSKGSNRCPRSPESGTTRAHAFEPILEPAGSRAPHMSCSRASEGS
jgi:hypothetical protein